VADDHHGPGLADEFLHPPSGLDLKGHVPGAEHLVDQQDVGSIAVAMAKANRTIIPDE